ncbi:MAG TPA: DinB family protein [Vicinamibacterales bacterium]|jgi:uncharacterized damage-inducible protein DinB
MLSRTIIATAVAVLAVFLCAPCSAVAQDRTYTSALKGQWDQIKAYVAKAADQMPEDVYSFKPTPKIRSFGELIAHVSDASYGICALAVGDKSRSFGNAEKTLAKKADIQEALKAAFAYCDAAFEKLNDETGKEIADLMGQRTPRLLVLAFNTQHTWEHYGNIVTYFRLKDMVPPSSQRGM